jgi:hypothetical protein
MTVCACLTVENHSAFNTSLRSVPVPPIHNLHHRIPLKLITEIAFWLGRLSGSARAWRPDFEYRSSNPALFWPGDSKLTPISTASDLQM